MRHLVQVIILLVLFAVTALAQSFSEADRLFTYGEDSTRDNKH
jgi:hypothetical protein